MINKVSKSNQPYFSDDAITFSVIFREIRQMTSYDGTRRRHVGIFQKLQEVFILMLLCYGVNMKPFA